MSSSRGNSDWLDKYQSDLKAIRLEREAGSLKMAVDWRKFKLRDFAYECILRRHGYDMVKRLERAVADGYWEDDNTGPAGGSVVESDERFRAVMLQVAKYFGDQGSEELRDRCEREARGEETFLVYTEGGESAGGNDAAHTADGGQDGIAKVPDEEVDDTVQDMEDGKCDIVKREDTGKEDIGPNSLVGARIEDRPRVTQGENRVVWNPASSYLDTDNWPAEGFADDDPAANYMIDILQFFNSRCENRVSSATVLAIETPEHEDRRLRPFQQALRFVEGKSHTNFFLQNPKRKGRIMGKVQFDKIGLTILIQAVRMVVGSYGDLGHIPPLGEHKTRLNASKGAMDFIRHNEDRQTCYVFVEPYRPEGVRSALAALQAGVRYSTAGHVLFYVIPVDEARRQGRLGAVLDIHPVMGWDE